MADVEYSHHDRGISWTGVGAAAGGLALLGNAMNNRCGNNCGGFLGNLFGGNNCCNNGCGSNGHGIAEVQYVSQLQAEIAQLKAEKSTDEKLKEVYMQTLTDNNRVRDELYAFIKPLAEEAADNRVEIATLKAEQKCCGEKQELREQILAGKINETALALNGKFDTMSALNKGAFDSLNQTIQCITGNVQALSARLDDITDVIVPKCKVCPEPMNRFNTWAAPTAQAPSCGACPTTA